MKSAADGKSGEMQHRMIPPKWLRILFSSVEDEVDMLLVLDCRNRRHFGEAAEASEQAAGKEGGPAAHPLPGNAAPLLPPPHP